MARRRGKNLCRGERSDTAIHSHLLSNRTRSDKRSDLDLLRGRRPACWIQKAFSYCHLSHRDDITPSQLLSQPCRPNVHHLQVPTLDPTAAQTAKGPAFAPCGDGHLISPVSILSSNHLALLRKFPRNPSTRIPIYWHLPVSLPLHKHRSRTGHRP
jgi:hypothetical protein